MKRLGLVYLSLMYQIKDILHRNDMNTIDEEYQSETYRRKVPFYVKVTDSFDDVYKHNAILPCVVVSSVRADESGLQIGGGHRNFRDYDIDIYARRNGERDDLTTIIYEGLDREADVRDFNTAFPEYTYDVGLKRLVEHFSGPVPNAISDLMIESKSVEYLPRIGPMDIYSHRAVIRLRTEDLR